MSSPTPGPHIGTHVQAPVSSPPRTITRAGFAGVGEVASRHELRGSVAIAGRRSHEEPQDNGKPIRVPGTVFGGIVTVDCCNSLDCWTHANRDLLVAGLLGGREVAFHDIANDA